MNQQGSMLVSLSLLVFVIALVAAGGVGWLLWRDAGYSVPALQQLVTEQSLPPTASPSPTMDALRPIVTIDPALQSEAVQFEEQLISPLLAYYATKPERLGAVTVTTSDKPGHSTKVSYELTKGSEHRTQTFYYDRTGTDKQGPYPVWSPTLLDITE